MVWKHDTVTGADGKTRCGWVSADPLYEKYHDKEWGRPIKDDRALFELLLLEGCQAGLSWITVLRKRPHYRKVYDGFDPHKIARYTPAKLARLLVDPGIIRLRARSRRASRTPGPIWRWSSARVPSANGSAGSSASRCM